MLFYAEGCCAGAVAAYREADRHTCYFNKRIREKEWNKRENRDWYDALLLCNYF